MEIGKEEIENDKTHSLIDLMKSISSEQLMYDSNKVKNLKLGYKFTRKNSLHESMEFLHGGKLSELGKVSRSQDDLNQLDNAFDEVSPLIYLTGEQRKLIRSKVFFLNISEKTVLYSGSEKKYEMGDYAAFILLKGEVHFFDNDLEFQDIVQAVSFFGYDGPIFRKRQTTVIADAGVLVAVILPEDFLNALIPFSKFCTFISRNIVYKDKTLDSLGALKGYILNNINCGTLNMKQLLHLHKDIDSCLHKKAKSKTDLDISAWIYSLNRLPQDIFKTFIYVLVNKPPNMHFLEKGVADELIPKVRTKARNRDIFRYLEGKGMIIVRDLETDVLDFISNLCIHMIESKKLRKMIHSPTTISKLHTYKDDFEQSFNFINSLLLEKIPESDKECLQKFFGNNFGRNLIDLNLHYQDYYVSIVKMSLVNKDPVESWIQGIWNTIKDLLNVNSCIDEIDNLVVDIIQGSKRTLLGCLSPYIYQKRETILSWARENSVKTITKEFLNESDRLLAYSYHYFKAFPDKKKDQAEMDKAYGIVTIEEHYSTGVQVIIINPNKLNPQFVDPNLKFKKVSENHILFHIGYTFGAQSTQIIKPLIMLFGSKARSFNIIGKAGGLCGNRTEIMVANKIFYDKGHEMVNVNPGNIVLEELKSQTKSDIHLGPMLTVAGTIMQNDDLLRFYKEVMGCVGLEMEGYFFAKEIDTAIGLGLLPRDFVTRCFYYISDLPLLPNQNLSMEEGNVSWDEGVGSMNAIQRYILNKIFA
jgi:hypothetical protein